MSEYLPVALRAFTKRRDPAIRRPKNMLVLDFETQLDVGQDMSFGSYRHCRCDWKKRSARCVGEGLVYADTLPERDPVGFKTLRDYAASHAADVDLSVEDADPRLGLLSRRAFVDNIFYSLAYKARSLVVGFNLPYDLSRLAEWTAKAEDEFAGGFSLVLWVWERDGAFVENKFRPRLRVLTIDSKRHLLNFGNVFRGDEEYQGHRFAGHFLDLRTLAFALTNESYTLARACRDFGVEHSKQEAERHGVIDPEYIDYNRRDVLATFELAMKLLAEYDRHPISPHYERNR